MGGGALLQLPLSCISMTLSPSLVRSLQENTQSTLCLMLDILGWSFDREDPKSDDFSDVVSALGVQFHLADTCKGVLNICNTEKGIRETLALLDEVMSKGLGRLLCKHAYNKPFREQLASTTLNSMKLLRSRIAEGKPTRLTCELLETLFFSRMQL